MVMDDAETRLFGRQPLAVALAVPASTRQPGWPDTHGTSDVHSQLLQPVGNFVWNCVGDGKNSGSYPVTVQVTRGKEPMAGEEIRCLAEEDVFPAGPDDAPGDLVSKTVAADAAEPDGTCRQPGFTRDSVIQRPTGQLESHQRYARSGPGLEHAPSGT